MQQHHTNVAQEGLVAELKFSGKKITKNLLYKSKILQWRMTLGIQSLSCVMQMM